MQYTIKNINNLMQIDGSPQNGIMQGEVNPSGRHTEPAVTGAYQTNAFQHGIGNSAVSSQWFSRPDDQKFLSLDEMLAFN